MPKISRAALKDTLWGSILLWYLQNHDSDEPRDTCELRKIILWSAPMAWLFETGVELKTWLLIRPITGLLMVWYGFITVQLFFLREGYDGNPVGAGLFFAYLAVGVFVGTYLYKNDPNPTYNRWTDRLLYFGLLPLAAVATGAVYIVIRMVMSIFNIAGRIKFLIRFMELMEHRLYRGLQVWMLVVGLPVAVLALIWWETTLKVLTVLVVSALMAVILILIIGGLVWISKEGIPALKKAVGYKPKDRADSDVAEAENVRRFSTKDLIRSWYESVKNRVCLPIQWTGTYR